MLKNGSGHQDFYLPLWVRLCVTEIVVESEKKHLFEIGDNILAKTKKFVTCPWLPDGNELTIIIGSLGF